MYRFSRVSLAASHRRLLLEVAYLMPGREVVPAAVTFHFGDGINRYEGH